MNTERNCQTCKYYKDGYCENLELKPCYPSKGCGDFSKRFEVISIEVLNKIRKRIELEKLGYPPSAGYYKAIMKCLQIIDKCKAESEVKA
jgi:hypothetical protein